MRPHQHNDGRESPRAVRAAAAPAGNPRHLPQARRTRRIMLILAVGGSLAAGFALVWLYAPGAFRPLSTMQLVVILALLALPLGTAFAVHAERRARARLAAADGQPEPMDPLTPARPPPRTIRHAPAERGAAEPPATRVGEHRR